jgi:hypothetical protein
VKHVAPTSPPDIFVSGVSFLPIQDSLSLSRLHVHHYRNPTPLWLPHSLQNPLPTDFVPVFIHASITVTYSLLQTSKHTKQNLNKERGKGNPQIRFLSLHSSSTFYILCYIS